jgi:hypothetical protein
MVKSKKRLFLVLIIAAFVLLGLYAAYVYYSINQLGQAVGGLVKDKGKKVMLEKYIYGVFDVKRDTINLKSDNTEDSKMLEAIIQMKFDSCGFELLKDAFWLKPILLSYRAKFGCFPQGLKELNAPPAFTYDCMGKQYYYWSSDSAWVMGYIANGSKAADIIPKIRMNNSRSGVYNSDGSVFIVSKIRAK